MQPIYMKMNIPLESFILKKIFSVSVIMLGVQFADELTSEEFRKVLNCNRYDVATNVDQTLYLNARPFEVFSLKYYFERIEREKAKIQKIINSILNREVEFTVFGVVLDPFEVSDSIERFTSVTVKFIDTFINSDANGYEISNVKCRFKKNRENAIQLSKFMKMAQYNECSIANDDCFIYLTIQNSCSKFRNVGGFLTRVSEMAELLSYFSETDHSIITVETW